MRVELASVQACMPAWIGTTAVLEPADMASVERRTDRMLGSFAFALETCYLFCSGRSVAVSEREGPGRVLGGLQ